jgi:hypothetical protein
MYEHKHRQEWKVRKLTEERRMIQEVARRRQSRTVARHVCVEAMLALFTVIATKKPFVSHLMEQKAP